MAPAMEVTTAKRKRTVASHAEGDVDGVNEEIDADNLTNDVHDKGAEHEKVSQLCDPHRCTR